MTDHATCPKCGAELTAADAELCPGCLLKMATDSVDSPDEIEATVLSNASGGFTPPEPADLDQHLPSLNVLELIGRGGMGAVYTARQKDLDRIVAVKVLPKEVQDDPGFGERFIREARTLAKLNHPNIVSVYDFGQAGDLFYFVMEYVDGVTLRETIAAGGVTPEEALRIVPGLCDALQYAHEEGVVHRDIKPENILLDRRGRVKIADFGLAKLMVSDDAEPNLTQTHQVMGTVKYMAPEQMSTTKNVDHRADIYSLGVIFYELLTGELPMGWFAPPSKKVAVDVRMDEVVLRALESEPSRRFQHASEIKTAVEALASAELRQPAVMDSGQIRLHKILDETRSKHRRLQQACLAFCFWSVMVAIWLFVAGKLPVYYPLGFLAAAVVLGKLSSMLKKDQVWEATYKGHTIRLDNSGLWAERLYLDDGLVQKGGLGTKMEFRFPIKAGEGLGDEIAVWFDATAKDCRCRIEVEEKV